MTEQRQPGPTRMVSLQTKESAASSEEILKAHSMNYWLERISPEDISKLWAALQATAKGAPPSITLEIWANGTILNRDYRVVVTAPITGDGFVMSFTVRDT